MLNMLNITTGLPTIFSSMAKQDCYHIKQILISLNGVHPSP